MFLVVLPPPVLPRFCPLFASLVNMLQCDVLLGILGAVLQWAMEPSGGHWSESMLQRVRLHELEHFLILTTRVVNINN